MAAGEEGMLVRQALPPTSQVPTTRQEASGEAPEEGLQGRPGGAEAHSLGEVGKTVCVSEVRPPEPGQEAEGLQGFLCPAEAEILVWGRERTGDPPLEGTRLCFLCPLRKAQRLRRY